MARSVNPDVRVIYGGTFDPFHLAHEAVCEAILAQPEVTELRLIPCAQPALKGGASASAEDRLAMLRRWKDSQDQSSRIVVDDQEIRRQGVSYSSRTVRDLQDKDPSAMWLFALGTDAWNSLPRWHDVETLKQRLSFWVFHRAGEPEVKCHSGMDQVKQFAALIERPSRFFKDVSVNIRLASSGMRQTGRSMVLKQTPSPVAQYIETRGLY